MTSSLLSEIVNEVSPLLDLRYGDKSTPYISLLCEMLSKLASGKITHACLQSLKDMSGDALTMDQIMDFSSFMCSDAVGILSPQFKIFDNGLSGRTISIEQVSKALKDDRFVREKSGREIRHFKERIYLFYVPTKKLVDILPPFTLELVSKGCE
jgi:hypothetical protein